MWTERSLTLMKNVKPLGILLTTSADLCSREGSGQSPDGAGAGVGIRLESRGL